MIDTQGTGTVSYEALEAAVKKVFRLTPSGIIEMLDLARPIYRQTAAYGHFGRGDVDLVWERTDRAQALRSALG
jgi:S-adenosylmethionine synthetase